ncbi:MAG: hypothetical protein GF383_09150 [Candidatus Lokiarchaeota archaeon]|nr:hypothetical protein [Candidatus Lokiarchaeota archaeon]MBD3340658.1 hypothetical protein [Candidatus Lokiarchaeota archaeon]
MVAIKLELLEIMQGSFSLIYITITLILIIVILGKFLKNKKSELLFLSLAILGLMGAWTSDAVVFLVILLTNASLNEAFYLAITIKVALTIGVFYVPFAIFCWLIVITKLLFLKNRKIILIIAGIICIIFEIIFILLFLIDIALIADFRGPFDYQWSLIPAIFLISAIMIVLTTGIVFTQRSLRSEKVEIKLKGKLILIGVLLFFLGAVLPYLVYNIVIIVITRIVLTISSIAFYIGFILPNWARRIFKVEG